MLERFLKQTSFASYDDFMANFELIVPENFNFGYDVVDAWAETAPQKVCLTWIDEHGAHRSFTFADMKDCTDSTAAFFASLGIGRGSQLLGSLLGESRERIEDVGQCYSGVSELAFEHFSPFRRNARPPEQGVADT